MVRATIIASSISLILAGLRTGISPIVPRLQQWLRNAVKLEVLLHMRLWGKICEVNRNLFLKEGSTRPTFQRLDCVTAKNERNAQSRFWINLYTSYGQFTLDLYRHISDQVFNYPLGYAWGLTRHNLSRYSPMQDDKKISLVLGPWSSTDLTQMHWITTTWWN